jgi:hypothetical protein
VEGNFLFYDGIGQVNSSSGFLLNMNGVQGINLKFSGIRTVREWSRNGNADQRNNSSTNTGKKSRKKRSGTEGALEEYYSTKEDDGTDTMKQDKGKEATANKGKESTAEKEQNQVLVTWESVSSKYHQEANSQIVNIVARTLRGENGTQSIFVRSSLIVETSGSDKFTITCVVFIH